MSLIRPSLHFRDDRKITDGKSISVLVSDVLSAEKLLRHTHYFPLTHIRISIYCFYKIVDLLQTNYLMSINVNMHLKWVNYIKYTMKFNNTAKIYLIYFLSSFELK